MGKLFFYILSISFFTLLVTGCSKSDSPTPAGPNITGINPLAGHPGDTIAISGTNLVGSQSTQVYFTSNIAGLEAIEKQATIVSAPNTLLRVLVPSDPMVSASSIYVLQDGVSSQGASFGFNSNYWKSVTAAPETARASFSIGNLGYFITPSEVVEFRTDSAIAKVIASLPATASIPTAAFSVGYKGFVIFSGSNGSSQIWQFIPGSKSWTQKTSAPVALGTNSNFVFVIDQKAYVGSDNLDSGTGNGNPFYSYDTNLDQWEELPNYPGTNATGVAAIALNQLGYCFGGGFPAPNSTSGKVNNGNWTFDPSTKTWTQIEDLPDDFTDRSFGIISTDGTDIYFGAGQGSGAASPYALAMYRYNIQGHQFWQLHSFVPWGFNSPLPHVGFQANGKAYYAVQNFQIVHIFSPD